MYLIRGLQIVCALLVLSSAAFADVLKDEADARHLTDQIMAKFSAGDADGGFQSMKPFLGIPLPEFDVMVSQMKMQQSTIDTRFGKSVGSEFIREDRIGQNLLRIVQFHRFERHALRWTFYFYKGKDGWILDSLKSDDDVRQWFPN